MKHATRSMTSAFCLSAALAVVPGCSTTSTGMGGGNLSTPGQAEEPVLLSWQSHDGGISGTLAATLPQRTFVGQFMQITLQTRHESLAPFWYGWNEGWGDWPYGVVGWDAPSASEQFTRYYSGKVIANLRDGTGQGMRCRFDLDDAIRGMSGGAHGQCQVAGGKILNAKIDKR